ncbi:MAG TPA: fatty acyl-AMP ligase [Pseudomonadales bacterium]
MLRTENNQSLDFKSSGFGNLVAALEYAAEGSTGINFYDGRGELERVLSYRELRDRAKVLAAKLLSTGVRRGDRVAIIAETHPMFHQVFFAAQYAGLLPVALPAGVQLGAHDAYVAQLRRMLEGCGAAIAMAPPSHVGFLREAAKRLSSVRVGTLEDFEALEASDRALEPLEADEPAYLQFTSGSTRFPRGVEITQASVMNNLREIAEVGLRLDRGDRFVSWLPLYHDMGLVGFVLLPLATQLSVDLLSPRTFAMRPRLWLKLISENRGTVSSSPPFGYALCAKRLRPSDTERYDLSCWRAACVGAERIQPKALYDFAAALASTGFDPRSFVPCYGMAECALAVSFAPLGSGLSVDRVQKKPMAESLVARPVTGPVSPVDQLEFVDCGEVLPSYEFAIRDEAGRELPERHCGHVCLRGPSVMRGYYRDPAATAEVLTPDGWLDTGDIGYRVGNRLFLTARSKDVIIINGRNIWPQDLEHLADDLPGVRQGNVSAFAAPSPMGEDLAVLVVECREQDAEKRLALVAALERAVRTHFGIHSYIDLVPPGTLPRTSSGKLARSRTREDFLERIALADSGWYSKAANG